MTLSSNTDTMLLAGSQAQICTMKNHLVAPNHLVGIRQIDGLSVVKDVDDILHIGAVTTHAELAVNADVKRLCPVPAGGIWNPALRHMGTIGGLISNHDPSAEYPAWLWTLGATIVTNIRELSVDDFFQGMFAMALADDKIITAVKVLAPAKVAYGKFRQPASLYAVVSVFMADDAAGTRVARCWSW